MLVSFPYKGFNCCIFEDHIMTRGNVKAPFSKGQQIYVKMGYLSLLTCIQHVFLSSMLISCKHQSSLIKEERKIQIVNSSPKRSYTIASTTFVFIKSLLPCHYHLLNQKTKMTVHLRLVVNPHYVDAKPMTYLCFPLSHV